eukprot:8576200-Alexandrium_andersonii.AAC.1
MCIRDSSAQALPLVVLVDANARLGSVTSPQVGRYGAEQETPSGKALRAAVAQASLFLPTTFAEHAQGVSPATW